MDRAMELAHLGLGKVSPNPMVGCVIVKGGKIIGEGWHEHYGGPHAEVMAVNSVRDKNDLKDSEVYVTLEPCSHYGKTPPCADLLVGHQVGRVYVSNPDINPLVSGKGIQKMKDASVHVDVGLMEEEGMNLNKRFFTFHKQKRPYIILKWAQTADRFIARKNFDSKWISNEYSRQLVHKWRTEEDGILVGANTALHDNPRLNVRDWPIPEQQPVRILIDPNLKVPNEHFLLDGSQRTLIYNHEKNDTSENKDWIKLTRESFTGNIFKDLYQKNIQSILVEGGAHLINILISEGLWDEARVFTADTTFGDGIQAPHLFHASLTGKRNLINDSLHYFKRADG